MYSICLLASHTDGLREGLSGLYHSTSGGIHTSNSPPPPYCAPARLLQETTGTATSSGSYGFPPGFAGEEAQRGAEITSFCDKASCDSGESYILWIRSTWLNMPLRIY